MLTSRTHRDVAHARAWDPLADWRPRSARRGLLVAALGAGVLLAAAGLGWLVGGWIGSDTPPPRAAATQMSSVGPLRIALDGTWSGTRVRSGSAYADLTDVRAFAPVPGAPATVLLGRSDAPHRSLVPSAIRNGLAFPLPSPRSVTIAGRPAWAYRGLRQRDGSIADLLVAPMTDGNLIVACTAPPGWWTSAAGCERGVRSIVGPPSLAPSPALAADRVLPAALERLNRARRSGGVALRRARTRRGQAAALRGLARAHATARRTLAPVLAADSSVLSSLARTTSAYGTLARAADHGSRPRYRRARLAARKAGARLRHALAHGT